MMTDKELQEIIWLSDEVCIRGANNVIVYNHRKNGVPNGLFALEVLPKLLAHIDEIEKKLITSNHRYLDLQQICDDQAKQIDEQAEYIKELEEHADDHAAKYKTDMDDWRSQLATLKAALIKERLRDNYSCIKIDSYNPFRHHKEKLTPDEAKDQLVKEYPEINWEE